MFRSTVTAVIASLAMGLVAAAPARSHSTWWYWAEPAAEYELEQRYSGIDAAYCYGKGKTRRVKSGLRGYKHFWCSTAMSDGSDDGGTLHVRGRNRFKFIWD